MLPKSIHRTFSEVLFNYKIHVNHAYFGIFPPASSSLTKQVSEKLLKTPKSFYLCGMYMALEIKTVECLSTSKSVLSSF